MRQDLQTWRAEHGARAALSRGAVGRGVLSLQAANSAAMGMLSAIDKDAAWTWPTVDVVAAWTCRRRMWLRQVRARQLVWLRRGHAGGGYGGDKSAVSGRSHNCHLWILLRRAFKPVSTARGD